MDRRKECVLAACTIDGGNATTTATVPASLGIRQANLMQQRGAAAPA